MTLGIIDSLELNANKWANNAEQSTHAINIRAMEALDKPIAPRLTIGDALAMLKIDNTWNTGKSVSKSPYELNWEHIAECLLTSTTNYNYCLSTSAKYGGWGDAIIYWVIIDDRVIQEAEKQQEKFKKRSLHSKDLLSPNASSEQILEHLSSIKDRLSFDQIQRLLRIYDFTEKNPLQ